VQRPVRPHALPLEGALDPVVWQQPGHAEAILLECRHDSLPYYVGEDLTFTDTITNPPGGTISGWTLTAVITRTMAINDPVLATGVVSTQLPTGITIVVTAASWANQTPGTVEDSFPHQRFHILFGLDALQDAQRLDCSFGVALSNHADFDGTLEYIKATKAKYVVTDNVRGGHGVELALEIRRRLSIPARPSSATYSREWGVA
jgi:hypothetical protein